MKKRRIRKRKIVLAFLIFLVILALLIFGAKTYLFVNLFLGNDVLITLTTDNENFFLSHGESQDIKIKTDILTNPFCSINCDYTFVDISSGYILDRANFSLKTITPVTKNYTLIPPSKGIGQKLYRFDIKCNSKKTFLCHTEEEVKKRNILITLNYDFNTEEKEANQEYEAQILGLLKRKQLANSVLNAYQDPLDKLNQTLIIDSVIFSYNSIKPSLGSINSSIQNLTILLNDQNYNELGLEIQKLNKTLLNLETNVSYLNKTILNLILEYNQMLLNLTELQISLTNLQLTNVSNETLVVLNKAIKDFNLILTKTSLDEKKIEIIYIYSDLEVIKNQISNSSNLTRTLISNEPLNLINITKINIPTLFEVQVPLFLKEKAQTCCLYNKCKECCNNSCYYDQTKFPIIFIHGHDFSKTVSAEYNLNIFDEMQRLLEKEGYIDAGSVLITSEEENLSGIWGKVNYPITVKASYYFDTYQTSGKNIILQTKQDNLDTYAVRLNDIVHAIKFRTNKEKIILVTHSMGGLVTRRYLQIFGENDVYKVILIASPNHGVNGTVLKYCSVFGSKLECDDMAPDSLFLNKLTNAKNPAIPVYNIIGIGCNTGGETGDSVVTNKSAYLSYAKNYFVNGTCEEPNFNFLHTKLVDPNKNPEVYNIVKNILKSQI